MKQSRYDLVLVLYTIYRLLPPDGQEPPAGCWNCADLEPFLEFIQSAVASGKFAADPLIPVQLEPCSNAAYLATKRALEDLK